MNTMTATAAPEVYFILLFIFLAMSPGGDGVLLPPMLSMSMLPQVNRSAAETRRQHQEDSGSPGARSSGGGADEITLCGMDVIGPRACHQHTGPPAVLRLHREGQRRGEGSDCRQFGWREGGKVSARLHFGLSVLLIKRSLGTLNQTRLEKKTGTLSIVAIMHLISVINKCG